MGWRDDSDGGHFERADASTPPASDLLEAMIVELSRSTGASTSRGAERRPADFARRRSFLVGYEDGTAICCGGIKRLPDGACEIKRMYVVPEARGRGVAKQLLVALEDEARELGYTSRGSTPGPSSRTPSGCTATAGYADRQLQREPVR
jgi:GNAT superfamily N-acetyltransferase